MNTNAPNQPPEPEASPPPKETLFQLPPGVPAAAVPPTGGVPRMQRAERQQAVMRVASLDALLPEEHQARVVWEYVSGLDLTVLYQQIRAVEGRAGRDPIDPGILLALWLYGTLDGVGSARALDRLCKDHLAYQWLCGEVSVNYHTLADFRVDHEAFLDQLLTAGVATLRHEGLVTLERVAQDGVRVRASAGAASFRRRATLQECLTEAEAQVAALRQELETDPGGTTRRQRAARARAARERVEGVRRALAELPAAEASKKGAEAKAQARVSTTDPQVRVMKMGDGGFRPAVNVQLATDTGGQIITGVDVNNCGSDQGQLAPMLEQHQERYDAAPKEMLVDGGFTKKDDLERASGPEFGTTVYAPVQKAKKDGQDAHAPHAGDGPGVVAWRARMATAEAKEIYKERAATAECVNAIARNRGLQRFWVRGLKKIRAAALWFALAHNLVRGAFLRAQAALRRPGRGGRLKRGESGPD